MPTSPSLTRLLLRINLMFTQKLSFRFNENFFMLQHLPYGRNEKRTFDFLCRCYWYVGNCHEYTLHMGGKKGKNES